jgi:polyribonucleotide nucleotidyltransferase
MIPKSCKRSLDIGGRTLEIRANAWARQADGSAWVRYGDSVVFVTACAQRDPRTGVDFLPLTVDYREYTYAAGKIPGGYFKREGRPTEKETVTSRLIDRPLRPLFPDGYANETQVIAMVLSSDRQNDTDVHAITGAGAALYLSSVPFHHPVAAVRVGLIEGSLALNPTFEELQYSNLDLVVAGTDEALVMLEGSAREVSEQALVDAIERARKEILRLTAAQKEMFVEIRPEKIPFTPIPEVPADVAGEVAAKAKAQLQELIHMPVKIERQEATQRLQKEILAALPEDVREEKGALYKRAFHDLEKEVVRGYMFSTGKRTDGRGPEDIRPIDCEVGVLPRTHGSALFRRGETIALVTCTLGTPDDVQHIEALHADEEKRFMLHYNFPPFSVGEVAFLRGPKRREIGHGRLAERALRAVLPGEDFPYTLRVVSDILESNGSSSQATVCGGSLAMMDAGVPVADAVAGIAMGLFKDEDTGKVHVLSDIAGYEDHYGDMDFKVAGTAKGVTALQMDIKITGVDTALLQRAFDQARRGRIHILGEMARCLESPREELSRHAPRMIIIQVDKEDIGGIIGPGGKTIRGIEERTGAELTIEDDGRVFISSVDAEAAEKAAAIVRGMTEKPEVGKIYEGTVQTIKEFGAFVEILPGQDGLLHVSEIAPHRVERVEDELKEGDVIKVKLINIDSQGRLKLSKRAAEGHEPAWQPGDDDRRPRREGRGGGRGGDRGGRGGGRGRR